MNDNSNQMWIDTHAHLDKLSPDTSEILRMATEASVFRIVTIGTEFEDWSKIIKLCEEFSPQVYGSLGMHPHSAKDYNNQCEEFLKKNLTHKRIVAVGEIGLDYYYEKTNRSIQAEVFEKQMSLAKTFQLPVEIHTREAEEETACILKQYQGSVRGLLHCFTGSYHLAKQALDYGFNISFSGILTFKNSESLRETCSKIPLDRLHIETDSPFLSPIPYRGKENNPARVCEVAKQMALLHNVSLQDLSDQLKNNTWDLFLKMKKEEECLQ